MTTQPSFSQRAQEMYESRLCTQLPSDVFLSGTTAYSVIDARTCATVIGIFNHMSFPDDLQGNTFHSSYQVGHSIMTAICSRITSRDLIPPTMNDHSATLAHQNSPRPSPPNLGLQLNLPSLSLSKSVAAIQCYTYSTHHLEWSQTGLSDDYIYFKSKLNKTPPKPPCNTPKLGSRPSLSLSMANFDLITSLHNHVSPESIASSSPDRKMGRSLSFPSSLGGSMTSPDLYASGTTSMSTSLLLESPRTPYDLATSIVLSSRIESRDGSPPLTKSAHSLC